MTAPDTPPCGDENPEDHAGEPVDDGWGDFPAPPDDSLLLGHPGSDRKDEP